MIHNKVLVAIIFGIFFFAINCLADSFSSTAAYDVCFTPGGNCTSKIVGEIYNAKKEILMQAFSFTSFKIAKALVSAKNRGIDVKILVDKSELEDQFSLFNYCQKRGLSIKIDYLPNIAHNKVIIIDSKIVITGSFNFTKAAETHNAENLLIISDEKLAEKYTANWQKRALQSISPSIFVKNQNIGKDH